MSDRGAAMVTRRLQLSPHPPPHHHHTHTAAATTITTIHTHTHMHAHTHLQAACNAVLDCGGITLRMAGFSGLTPYEVE